MTQTDRILKSDTMNILIVDDQEENRYLLEALFMGNGHEIQSAVNGQEALERLKSGQFDLIISDILMPVMDGFQLCRKVRADDTLRRMPFIFYTATYTGPKDEEFALKIGADRFILKPCEPEVLMTTVREVMAASGYRNGTPVPEPTPEEEVLQLYSERLVRKLEEKMLQAEREIEARREAEKALRDSEARLIAAQRLAKMGDVTWDLETGAITWSEALYDLLGYEQSEIFDYDRVNAQIHHPEDLERVTRWIEISIASGRDILSPCEYRVIKKNREIPFIRTVGEIQHRQGKKPFIFATIQDITGRIQAEDSLRASEEKYRRIFENSVVGIFQSTPQGRFITVNPAFAHMLGYASPEDQLSNISDISTQYYVHAEDRERYRQLLDKNGYLEHFEFEVKRSDGTPLWVSNSTRAHFGENGEILYYEGIVLDISKRRRAEIESDKLQVQLIQAQKMESVGRLAGGVAHDFNNMLGVIIGYAQLAKDKLAQDDPVYSDLQEILSAANRSADITRQLLAFARKQIVSPQILDLNESVEGMFKMLRRLIGEDIDLSWQPGSKLCPVRIDPSQLDQILANLCVNARDAIAGVGKLTIETKNVCFDQTYCAIHAGFIPGQYAMMAVSDTGCGINKEILNSLFEPFFTTREVGRGTGLGLATVYGIVKQNDGFINVYSEPGQGTIFRIYLPAHIGQTERITRHDHDFIPMGHGETILLVEDETAILQLGKSMLESLGYTVLAAAGAGESIALAQKHAGAIRLLITDVVLPEMNGWDLSQKLQAVYPDIRVLFMSGYTANALAHHGVLDKGVHFIQKPFSRQELAAKVHKALVNDTIDAGDNP